MHVGPLVQCDKDGTTSYYVPVTEPALYCDRKKDANHMKSTELLHTLLRVLQRLFARKRMVVLSECCK